jgi:hypothetical protein
MLDNCRSEMAMAGPTVVGMKWWWQAQLLQEWNNNGGHNTPPMSSKTSTYTPPMPNNTRTQRTSIPQCRHYAPLFASSHPSFDQTMCNWLVPTLKLLLSTCHRHCSWCLFVSCHLSWITCNLLVHQIELLTFCVVCMITSQSWPNYKPLFHCSANTWYKNFFGVCYKTLMFLVSSTYPYYVDLI